MKLGKKDILVFGSVLAISGVMAVASPASAQDGLAPPAGTAPVVSATPAEAPPPEAPLKQPDGTAAAVVPAPAPTDSAPAAVVVSTPGTDAASAPAAPSADASEKIISTTTVTTTEMKEEATTEKTTDKKKSAKKKKSKKDAEQAEKDFVEAAAPPANIRDLPHEYLVVKKDHAADDPDARLTAARAALSLERYDAALEMFEDLYARNPADKRVLMGRAYTLQKMGRAGEAIAAYESVLNADPKNIEALVNMLGILQTQDPALATERLAQLRQVYPYNPDIAAQLGMAYASAADYPNAIKYLDIADTLKTGNATVLYNRAVVYDRMGNKQKAADLYNEIMRLAIDGQLERNFPIDAVKKRLAGMR